MKTFTIALFSWLAVLSPVSADIGAAVPVALLGCVTRPHTEALVEVLVERAPILPNAAIPSCTGLFFAPNDLEGRTPIIGPLKDFEGDEFAVFEVRQVGPDGRMTDLSIYLFVYYRDGYKPAGLRI